MGAGVCCAERLRIRDVSCWTWGISLQLSLLLRYSRRDLPISNVELPASNSQHPRVMGCTPMVFRRRVERRMRVGRTGLRQATRHHGTQTGARFSTRISRPTGFRLHPPGFFIESSTFDVRRSLQPRKTLSLREDAGPSPHPHIPTPPTPPHPHTRIQDGAHLTPPELCLIIPAGLFSKANIAGAGANIG